MPVKAEELKALYDKVKKLMKPYEKGSIVARADFDSRYDLWSEKEVVIAGKKRKEVSFAALIIQSSYVGFYFMPAYTHEDTKRTFHPDLLKLLKGKSCFHLKVWSKDLEAMLKDALKQGYALYKERGWV